MQTRCPFGDCLQLFELVEDSEFTIVDCPSCSRRFTARTIARHLEIDKQLLKHQNAGTDSKSFFASGKNPGKFVAILEEIRSLWNVGSMFRSADAAGFSSLFLVGIAGCPPRKEIAKTSLGAEDHVAWSYSGNTLEVISSLKDMGYQIVALEKNKQSTALTDGLRQKQITSPLCLVVGSEVKGIYAETLAASDITVDLPMRGFKESLNVAVAFGIAAYAIAEALEN